MNTTIFMAQNLNAKIARETGEEDFLSPRNWREFKSLAENIGVFAVGRKTYEAVKEWGEKGFKDVKAKRIILSRKENFEPDEDYLKASSPEEAVKIAEKEGFEKLLVTGRASVNTSFLEKELVDEIILDIQPHILGRGLNIFAEGDFEESLNLNQVKELEEGIIQLRYTL